MSSTTVNPPDSTYPAFQIPLSDKEVATIGLIAVVWGQIDMLLDEVLLFAHEIDVDQRRELLGDTKQIGSKLDLVARGLNRIHPKETRALLQGVLEKLQSLKRDRNSLFHGCWGFKFDRKTKDFTDRGTLYQPSPDNPLRPSRLSPLLTELTECSRLLNEVFCDLKGWARPTGAIKLTWGGAGPDGGPSERLKQRFGPFDKGHPSRRRSP